MSYGKYRVIPNSPRIIKKRSSWNIVDGKYLATEYMCRWIAILIGDTRSLDIGLKNYEKTLMSMHDTLPLILPFGFSYILFHIEPRDGVMNLKISSPYHGDSIPRESLALLSYAAIENVRRGYYLRDPLMKNFEEYYTKISEKIPEDYKIAVNDEFAVFNYSTLEKTYDSLLDYLGIFDDFYFQNNSTECMKCPLKNICAQISNNLDFFASELPEREHRIKRHYDTLKNAGVDALLFHILYIFKYFPELGNWENLSNFVRHIPQRENASILLSSSLYNSAILSLKNGKIYTDPLEMISENSDMRVFDDSGDVTEKVVLQRILLESLFDSRKFKGIEKFLARYPENEKYLLYLSFLNIDDFSKNIYYTIGTIDENDDLTLYLNEKYGRIDVLNHIYNSKLYAEDLIKFDKENLSVYPTPKLIKILYSLWKEGGE